MDQLIVEMVTVREAVKCMTFFSKSDIHELHILMYYKLY